MTEPTTYKAFISYAHADAALAGRLQRKLENFKHSGAGDNPWPLRPVFLDRSELASSPDLSRSIEQALSSSDALIVICSQAAAQSIWVNAEILFFKRLGRTAVFPIIVSGDPGSDVAGVGCFPEALRFQLDEAGQITTIPTEPLAADARKGRDGRDAVLKLIAGLLDIPFDTLKLRQQRRRVRQAAGVAAGATGILLLTVYLAVSAVIAQQKSEHSRDQAETLIAFMLGDLRQRLQQVGRLDVLDGVGEKALEYFSGISESEMTTEALLTRATALRQIGEVRVAQGLIEEGLVAFNEAQTLLSQSSSENDAVRLFELGQVSYWIADAYFNDLQLDRAQTYIEKYLEISRKLVELEPNNPDYQLELLYAESNLGTLAFRANNLDTAREYFNRALAVGKKIAADRPGDSNEAELAITLSWLGAVEAAAGNFSESLNWYEQQLALDRDLMTRSENPSRKHAVGRSLFLIADIRVQLGNVAGATSALDESVQLYRDLVTHDPQNYDWQEELAWSLTKFTRESYTSGKRSAIDARAMLSRASEAIAHVDEGNTAEVSRVRAAIDIELGRIEFLEGNVSTALALARRAVDGLAPLISGGDRIRVLSLYARASYVAAEALLASGDEPESQRFAQSALEQLGLHADDPYEVRAYAALLAFRSNNPLAERLLANVAETEYREVAYLPGTETSRWWDQWIARSLPGAFE